MCCFSRPVISVSATNIFARPAEDGRQFLVYSMVLKAKEDLAMILPLSVKLGSSEDAVSFIDLSGYPEFFVDLRRGFPTVLNEALVWNKGGEVPAVARKLEVVRVGSFEASFVPTPKDFSRLDERFRIPDRAWKQLPQYHDFGFAVFKLKSGNAKVHPMAFSFPRRDLQSLFFPTVHIHDGKVHPKADFDHALYCQPSANAQPEIHGWEESYANAGRFMQVDKAKGLILADQHCYRKELRGRLPNRDTLVGMAA
jgi:hypothetical protein